MATMTAVADAVQRAWEANLEKEKILAATGFQSIFLQQPPMVELGSTAIEVESVKGYEWVAASVRRDQMDKQQTERVAQTGKAEAAARRFPLIREEFVIPANKTLTRVLGAEKPYESWSREERRVYLTMAVAKETVKAHIRKHELLAAESLTTGKITCADGQLDFQRDAALVARKVPVTWATTASCNPLKDIGDAQKAIRQKAKFGGAGMPIAIFGETAWANFALKMRSLTGLKEITVNHVNLDPSGTPPQLAFMIAAGFVYQGWVRTDFAGQNTHLFTYPEFYETSGGTSTPYIEANTCIVLNFEPSIFKSYYGPGELQADPNYYNTVMAGMPSDINIGLGQLAIGGAVIPAEVFRMTLFPIERGRGDGGAIESAPMPVVKNIDVVASIATTTTP